MNDSILFYVLRHFVFDGSVGHLLGDLHAMAFPKIDLTAIHLRIAICHTSITTSVNWTSRLSDCRCPLCRMFLRLLIRQFSCKSTHSSYYRYSWKKRYRNGKLEWDSGEKMCFNIRSAGCHLLLLGDVNVCLQHHEGLQVQFIHLPPSGCLNPTINQSDAVRHQTIQTRWQAR